MSKLPVGLQLYTVRDELQVDYAGTLRAVAEIGYSSVELAGTGDLTASELSSLLQELGLVPVGPHVGLEQLETELNTVLDYYGELGTPFVTCPYMPEAYRAATKIEETCALLNRIGQACKGRGMQFCYHNHNYEFDEQIGDRTLFDTIFDGTDPELVKGELDIYWAQYAGHDPATVIRQRSGRFPLIHLKDMTAGDPTFAEVGEGIIDMNAVFVASEAHGAQWYVVEQDRCQRPSLESARLSFENLKGMGKI
jgi:sugar phosphate isomerase/epimerase